MDEFLPASAVVKAAVESTEAYLRFLREKKLGVNKHRATNLCHIDDELLIESSIWHCSYRCRIPQHRNIRSDSAAKFIPHTSPGEEIEIRILEYDRTNGDTVFAARSPVEGPTGDIVIDFSWLVQRYLDWLKENGARISSVAQLPSHSTPVQPESNSDNAPSSEQQQAIEIALNSPLTYIWGPAGTGKTTRVLANAIRACVRQKERVLVVASMNVSVDNALEAVLGQPDEPQVDPKKVLRIGFPSKRFREKYPDCCEQRAFQEEKKRLDRLRKKKQSLEKAKELAETVHELERETERRRIAFEKAEQMLPDLVNDWDPDAQLDDKTARLEAELASKVPQHVGAAERLAIVRQEVQDLESAQIEDIRTVDELQRQLADLGFLARLFTRREDEFVSAIAREREHLRAIEATLDSKRPQRNELEAAVDRLAADVQRLRDITATARFVHRLVDEGRRADQERVRAGGGVPPAQYAERIGALEKEIADLEARVRQFEHALDDKSVIGMTLDAFIGYTLQPGLQFDRVFVDEAPYAALAKVLPLLILDCPIVMFGDHYQLPPVCECKNDAMVRAYWAKPGIFLEDAFRLGMSLHALNAAEKPRFRLTQRCDLNLSYRFGPTLASLLDRYIYDNRGLVGKGEDTLIQCIHCEPRDEPQRLKRQNHTEVGAIVDFIQRLPSDALSAGENKGPTIAVLTPYKHQATLFRREIGRFLGQIEVLNTHQALGREWDLVLFSVCDTGNLNMNEPYFTDSSFPIGKQVLLTTISRVRKKLVLFFDKTYWARRSPDSLLTALAETCCHPSGEPSPAPPW